MRSDVWRPGAEGWELRADDLRADDFRAEKFNAES